MELDVVKAELVLPTHLSFKQVQMYEKYPKGQSRGRHWKHLKQILQAENYQNFPTDEPTCKFLECTKKKGTLLLAFLFQKSLYINYRRNNETVVMGNKI